MQKTIIKNAHVVSPDVDIENATIVIEGKRIKSVTTRPVSEKGATTVVDVKGQYVMPGFIDVHTHGALTYDFCDPDPQAIFKLAEAKLAEGVTTVLPTTLTVSHEELMVAAANAKAYVEAGSPFAKVPGIHLEGPFINVKCCGAQNPKFVRKPEISEVKESPWGEYKGGIILLFFSFFSFFIFLFMSVRCTERCPFVVSFVVLSVVSPSW